MLTVKTKVSNSNVHGVGLFADQDIEEGTVIWRYRPSSCEIYHLDEFIRHCDMLDFKSIIDLLNYSYIKEDRIFHILGNAKYINHTLEPNIAFVDWETEIAIKDIRKGEEILENYFNSYDQMDFFTNSELFECHDREQLLNSLSKLHVNSHVLY